MQTQTHPSPQHQSLTEMLPDAILVRIGISVAELCGLGDFRSLSLTSKHFYGLLMDSKETVTISEIIRIRTIEEEESSNNKIWLPSYSLRPLRLRTLQQLALYESLKKLNLLSENRLCTSPNLQRDNRVHFMYPDLEICRKQENDRIVSCNILIHAIRNLLEIHPNLHVILDSHCGTRTPARSAWLYSHVRGRVVQEALLAGVNPVVADQAIRKNHHHPTRKNPKSKTDLLLLQKRISMRAWGTMVSKIVSGFEEHPYQSLAQEGKGWVEIYFRIDDPETEFPLVLPPRPRYYNKVAQEYHKQQQNLTILAQQQRSKNRHYSGAAIPCFSFCGIG